MAERILIVGGVAGGASAAARARRLSEDAEIIIFEQGKYISFANCGLPYYIGGTIKDRDSLLVSTPETFRTKFNIDVRTLHEVSKIDSENKTIEVLNLVTGETLVEKYDKLILSPGAVPAKPPIPGIDIDSILTLRNIPDTDMIKKLIDDKKVENTVIVGAGYIGLEMAENLAVRGIKVTIVEMLDQVMPPLDYEMAAIILDTLNDNNIKVKLGSRVTGFEKTESGKSIVLTDSENIETDLILLSIGVKPDIKLAAAAGLELGVTGGIKVDDHLRTSDPSIYAVGDAIEVTDVVSEKPVLRPLAGPANKQGRIAADNVFGRNSVFKGVLGTSILKLFDLMIACTGNNEKSLIDNNIPYLASYTHSASNAGYYPGGMRMAIKLLFSPGDGKILGAQIVGEKGADKRIDVIATAMKAQMNVFDLEELELAYAPPFSSAKDPVNIAGFVAGNILKGDHEVVHWNEIEDLDKEKYVFIELRDNEEFEVFDPLEGSLHIPLRELRSRLHELDRNKTYIPYCAIGLRGYLAHRILVQAGFKSKNLSGGVETYRATAGLETSP
ncbi:MAG TPA: FAD-dependent oxidoreductase [bacterium]|nr:FAD-dependent oxidoreductase [bacterium]